MKKPYLLAIIILMITQAAYALHPLNTDDTGTEGKGRWKLQVHGKWEHNEADGVVEDASKTKASVTVGVAENIDIEVGQPYKFKRKDDNGAESKTNGLADTEIEMKWRFYERNRLSFALLPSLTFPAGNDEKGLGAGKVTSGLFLLATRELNPWAFHVNVGYVRNANTADDRTDIWHLSAATEYKVAKGFVIVGETGIQSNEEKASGIYPVYATAGVRFYVVKNIKLDLGLRIGLSKAEPDYTVLPGITFKF